MLWSLEERMANDSMAFHMEDRHPAAEFTLESSTRDPMVAGLAPIKSDVVTAIDVSHVSELELILAQVLRIGGDRDVQRVRVYEPRPLENGICKLAAVSEDTQA